MSGWNNMFSGGLQSKGSCRYAHRICQLEEVLPRAGSGTNCAHHFCLAEAPGAGCIPAHRMLLALRIIEAKEPRIKTPVLQSFGKHSSDPECTCQMAGQIRPLCSCPAGSPWCSLPEHW